MRLNWSIHMDKASYLVGLVVTFTPELPTYGGETRARESTEARRQELMQVMHTTYNMLHMELRMQNYFAKNNEHLLEKQCTCAHCISTSTECDKNRVGPSYEKYIAILVLACLSPRNKASSSLSKGSSLKQRGGND